MPQLLLGRWLRAPSAVVLVGRLHVAETCGFAAVGPWVGAQRCAWWPELAGLGSAPNVAQHAVARMRTRLADLPHPPFVTNDRLLLQQRHSHHRLEGAGERAGVTRHASSSRRANLRSASAGAGAGTCSEEVCSSSGLLATEPSEFSQRWRRGGEKQWSHVSKNRKRADQRSKNRKPTDPRSKNPNPSDQRSKNPNPSDQRSINPKLPNMGYIRSMRTTLAL